MDTFAEEFYSFAQISLTYCNTDPNSTLRFHGVRFLVYLRWLIEVY